MVATTILRKQVMLACIARALLATLDR